MDICYLAPSKWLLLVLSGLYLNSAIALFLLVLPIIVKVILLLSLIYSWGKNVKLVALRSKPRSIIAVWYNERYWYAVDNRQVRFKGRIGKKSYRSNFLLVLNLVNNNRSKICVITRDALPEAEYRYLASGINNAIVR